MFPHKTTDFMHLSLQEILQETVFSARDVFGALIDDGKVIEQRVPLYFKKSLSIGF